MHRADFTIAGIVFRIDSDKPLSALGLMERFGRFAGDGSSLDILSLHWRDGDPDSVEFGQCLFDPGHIWRVHARADGEPGWVVRINYQQGKGIQAAMTVSADWSDVKMVERISDGPSLLACGAGELLFRARVLFADGLVFHASGVDDHGRGILFVGHSGAGKSTQALMWCAAEGVVAMNDDRVAVRCLPDGPSIYGTPWGGSAEIARNHRAPLRGIVVLEKASENELIAVSGEEAAPLLLPRAFLPYWDQGLMAMAADNLHAILRAAPVHRLRCRPEPAVMELVRGVLR